MADRIFEVIDCEQRSPEWFQARSGIVTASEAGALLAKPKKGADESVQRRDLRVRLALERLTGMPLEDGEGYLNGDMRRGIELEADARAAYEAHTGALVLTVGMLRRLDLPIGCSPDGIVGDFAGGLELKCPKAAVHYSYLKAGDEVPSEYRAQILHSLFVSGLPYWDLAAYNPSFPESMRLHVVRTRRENVDLAGYEATVRTFLAEVEAEVEAIRAIGRTREAA